MAIGLGVRHAKQGVPSLDDVVAEHPLALVDGATEEAGGARHADAQLAVVRDLQPLAQGLLEDRLVGAHLQGSGGASVLDRDLVGGDPAFEGEVAAERGVVFGEFEREWGWGG